MSKLKKPERILRLCTYLNEKKTPVSKEQIKLAFPDYQDILGKEAGNKLLKRDLKELSLQNYFDDASYNENDEINYKRIKMCKHKRFDAGPLTESEQMDLMNTLILFQGTGLTEVGTIINKFSEIINTKVDNWVSIDFSDWYEERLAEKVFEKLKIAILSRKIVKFNYRSWSSGDSKREVEPMELIFKHDAWYLQAYCFKNEAVVRFRISRIGNVIETNRCFDKRSVKEEEKIPKIQGDLTKFEFKISQDAGVKALDYFGNDWTKKEDYYLIRWRRRYNSKVEKSLVHGLILSFGEHLEVLEPAELREEIKQIHLRAAQKYN